MPTARGQPSTPPRRASETPQPPQQPPGPGQHGGGADDRVAFKPSQDPEVIARAMGCVHTQDGVEVGEPQSLRNMALLALAWGLHLEEHPQSALAKLCREVAADPSVSAAFRLARLPPPGPAPEAPVQPRTHRSHRRERALDAEDAADTTPAAMSNAVTPTLEIGHATLRLSASGAPRVSTPPPPRRRESEASTTASTGSAVSDTIDPAAPQVTGDLLGALDVVSVRPDYYSTLARLKAATAKASAEAERRKVAEELAAEEKRLAQLRAKRHSSLMQAGAAASIIRSLQPRKKSSATNNANTNNNGGGTGKPRGIRDLARSLIHSGIADTAPITCEHCHVSNEAPPVTAIRPVLPGGGSSILGGGAEKSVVAEKSLRGFLHDVNDGGRRVTFGSSSGDGPDVVYPVSLGLKDEEAVDHRLWAILAQCEWPDAVEELVDNKQTREHKAAMLAAHFQSRVGVPPWSEFFFKKRREEQALVGRQQAFQQAMNKRLASLQSKSATLKLEIAALEKALSIRDPVEHAAQTEVALAALKRDLDDLEETNNGQQQQLDTLQKYTNRYSERIVIEVEEVRRCINLLAQLHKLARDTENVPPEVMHADAIAQLIHPILERFPTLAMTYGHEFDDDDDGDVEIDPLGHQCPDCLLFKSSSPFCMVSGRKHQTAMPIIERPMSQHEADEAEMSASRAEFAKRVHGDGDTEDGETDGEPRSAPPEFAFDSDSTPTDVSDTSSDALSEASTTTRRRRAFRRAMRERLQKRHEEEKAKEEERAAEAAAMAAVRRDLAAEARERQRRVRSEAREARRRLKQIQSRYKGGGGGKGARGMAGRQAAKQTAEDARREESHAAHERLLQDLDDLIRRAIGENPQPEDLALGKAYVPPPGEEALAQHCRDYVEAAAGKNLSAMRQTAHRAMDEAAQAPTLNAHRHQLHEQESQFAEWYALMLLRTQDGKLGGGKLGLAGMLRSDLASGTTVAQKEAILRGLRKELRNLNYSFDKRPKGRAAGAALDDGAFKGLVGRIGELEKRHLHLRTRIKYAVSERHIVENKLAALKGEPGHGSNNRGDDEDDEGGYSASRNPDDAPGNGSRSQHPPSGSGTTSGEHSTVISPFAMASVRGR